MKPRNIQFSAPVDLFSYGTRVSWSAESHGDVKARIDMANRLVELTNKDGQVSVVFFEGVSVIRLAPEAAPPAKDEKKGGK